MPQLSTALRGPVVHIAPEPWSGLRAPRRHETRDPKEDQMKTWCVVATALLVLTAGAIAAGAMVLMRGGIGARAHPSSMETAIARRVRDAAIPAGAKRMPNPLPRTPEVIANGRAHFADHCASCHANDGGGDTKLGESLYPRVPDLREQATQGLSDGALFYIIENGVKFTGMPAWGSDGHADASWALVHFIRHLRDLTDEERSEMRRLNPKTLKEWRELKEDDAFLGEDPDKGAGPHEHH
jgi:mono/diheme cytochrome c family protein